MRGFRGLIFLGGLLTMLLAGNGLHGPPLAFAAATFTVNTAADSGTGGCDLTECTLREAIIAANADAVKDTIAFNISPSGANTITVTGSPLPTITQPVTIDGTTQPGYAGTPIIEINGSNVFSTGLLITSGNSGLKGLVINRFTSRGIDIQSNGNSVSNSYIGTDVSGTADVGNGIDGIRILDGSNNCIGGTIVISVCTHAAGDGNVISGNNQDGVLIQAVFATVSANVLVGNYVGTNASGSAALGNGANGVDMLASTGNIVGGVNGTTPGGACTGDCNLISGNVTGISVRGNDTTILGNFIGTDVTGTADLGNSFGGIRTSSDSGITGTAIGNGTPAGRNVVAGNALSGIDLPRGISSVVQGNYVGTNSAGNADLGNDQNGISVGAFGGSNTIGGSAPGQGNLVSGNTTNGIAVFGSSNVVRGNLIGVAADGTSALGNSLAGVLINGSNAFNNTIGGTDEGQFNVIAFNSGDGVRVATGTGNSIRGNSIYSNALKGIENLTGGNGEPGHAPPGITSVGSAAGTACVNCTIDVYSDSGGQGRTWEGATIADGAGNWKYFGPVAGPNLTATATNAAGSTSEFSTAFPCGDFDSDAVNNCIDSDDDNDGFTDDEEAGIAACKNGVNDDATDAETLFFVNDGCPAIGIPEVNCGGNLDNDLDGYPNDGCPKDGSYSEADFRIGTGSQDPCGNDGWPADLQANNKLDIGDVNSFLFPLRGDGSFAKFGHPVPDPDDATIARWNLQINGEIDIGDVNAVNPAVTASTARPPMFGDQPAFFTDVGNGVGGCPFAP